MLSVQGTVWCRPWAQGAHCNANSPHHLRVPSGSQADYLTDHEQGRFSYVYDGPIITTGFAKTSSECRSLSL